jgi:hypothetical protein
MPRAHRKAPTPGDNGHGDARFAERVGHLHESAHQLLDEARSTFEDLGEAVDIQGRVRRHPYGMVAAALGAGYVLGGGLFSPLTFRLLGLGVRLAAIPLVKTQLLGFAEAAVSGFTSEGDDEVSSPS